jgi:hypothetical protein
LRELLEFALHVGQDCCQAAAVFDLAIHYRLDLRMRAVTPRANAVPAMPARRATGFSSLILMLRSRTVRTNDTEPCREESYAVAKNWPMRAWLRPTQSATLATFGDRKLSAGGS